MMNVNDPSPRQAIPAPPAGHEDQWYHKNPALYAAEVTTMRKAHPHALLRFMPDSGDMCWAITLKIGGFRKPWQFLLRYEKQYPMAGQFGCPILVTLLHHPSLETLQERTAAAGRPGVPHLLGGPGTNYPRAYLSTSVQRGIPIDVNPVGSGAQMAAWAADWAARFEFSLYDDVVWNNWCNHTNYRDWMV